MSNFKDLFSNHSSDYKNYRPVYPQALFKYLAEQVSSAQAVWDCGTGNGQGAEGLAEFFDKVYATDASAKQIEAASEHPKIAYSVATAEHSGLDDATVNLVTVCQALHWFNLDAFYKEVRRISKPGALLAVIGYNTALTGIKEIDDVYKVLCFDYLWEKECWEMNRGSLNQNYQGIDFPFEETETPQFYIEMHWNYQEYLNYLNTWSAVKTHIKKYNENPVETFVASKIEKYWPNPEEKRLVKFPVILRLGVV